MSGTVRSADGIAYSSCDGGPLPGERVVVGVARAGAVERDGVALEEGLIRAGLGHRGRVVNALDSKRKLARIVAGVGSRGRDERTDREGV